MLYFSYFFYLNMTLEVNHSNFDSEVLKSNKPVLVDFWAPWCGPCRNLAPVLEEVSKDMTSIKIAKINVDDNPELSAQFRIQGIPAMILFKDGKVVANRVGLAQKQALIDWIQSNI